ncbi:hypothetical protein GCM10022236_14460 [Microlunatus ginsengisoli]|uniref:Uncharacterized protein n=1 Tax=Microlunatus ginsengisoli TaxID=363863 RepID=A0ABP6ZMN7_9ACTN
MAPCGVGAGLAIVPRKPGQQGFSECPVHSAGAGEQVVELVVVGVAEEIEDPTVEGGGFRADEAEMARGW